MTFDEKVFLWDFQGSLFDDVPVEVPTDVWTSEEKADDTFETSLHTPNIDLHKARDFLLAGEEYQMLVQKLRLAAELTPRQGTVIESVRNAVLEVFPDGAASTVYHRFTAEVFMDWSFEGFMSDQYGKEDRPSLCDAITITGSIVDAQAMTCGSYCSQTWPWLGLGVLQAIEASAKTKTLSGWSLFA